MYHSAEKFVHKRAGRRASHHQIPKGFLKDYTMILYNAKRQSLRETQQLEDLFLS